MEQVIGNMHLSVTDMKARTMFLAHGRVIKVILEIRCARTMSLAYGRVIKATCEYTKKYNYTWLSQVSLRNCITHPWASDIVKQKLVTKVSKGQEVVKCWNNSRPRAGVNG